MPEQLETEGFAPPEGPGVKIREASIEDFDSVVALYGEFGNRIPVAQGRDGFAHWKALLHHPGTTVHVAVLEDRLVAAATLHSLPNMTYGGMSYALIENVITARDQQGKGLGRQVMESAMAKAWQANAYKIMLLTGKNRKDGSVRGFYEKLGFSPDEKHGMTLRRVSGRDD